MSEFDEAVIRWTVRLAMACYAIYWLTGFCNFEDRLKLQRWFWTAGLAFFILHLLAAFGLYHHWSHLHAYQHTAERTFEATGWRWGGGLYLNYLVGIFWVFDVGLWWRVGLNWPQRHRALQIAWHCFFGFMVFNATVVFGPKPWITVGVVFGLFVAILHWRKPAPSI